MAHEEGRTLQTILSVMDSINYKVTVGVAKSQFYDVPQKRERLFIIGVRKDLKIPFYFPKQKSYTVSLGSAIQGVEEGPGMAYSEKKKSIMDMIPEGGYWRDLPEDIQKEFMGKSFYLGGGKTGMARRLSSKEPSLTLTCNPAQKQTERCHPFETRPLSVREYARVQTFPDEWKFEGSVSSQYRQIGNAVPVNLAYHVGKCLIAMLNGKPDPNNMIELPPANLSQLLPGFQLPIQFEEFTS
jgi:DNA (cytosine-5)-methyltransferase 1